MTVALVAIAAYLAGVASVLVVADRLWRWDARRAMGRAE